MESTFDPNVPDCSNGDFFCKLCLASMNSEQTWSSHIVGKRHIKNAQKYPNGLPNRYDGEDSYDGAENNDSYEKAERIDDYPPMYDDDYYYGQDYYNRKPVDYVPSVRPNVVIDYGHSKKLDDILPQDSKLAAVSEKGYFSRTEQCSKVAPQERKVLNLDDILDQIKSEQFKNSSGKVPEKDDFFEKINQRELARDLALELSKKRFSTKDVPDKNTVKSIESPKRKQDEEQDKKHSKRRSSSSILDLIHKHNDDELFKGSKIKDSKYSSSKKLEVKLKNIDPDELTTDVLDDLLSSHLKAKTNSTSRETVKNLEMKAPEVKVNMDDPEVIAEKLQKLPNKTFFQIVHNKLKKIEVKDSEELKMLLKIISEAQDVVSKKLPAHVQSALKAKASEKKEVDAQKTTVSESSIASVTAQMPSTGATKSVPSTSFQTQNTVVSQNYNVPVVSPLVQNTAGLQNYPTVSTVSQFSSPVPAPVISSLARSIPGASTLLSSTQTLSSRFPVLGAPPCPPLNSVSYPGLLQNYQANNTAMYYQMMQALYQNRQSVPSTNANSLPGTSSSPSANLLQPRFFQPNSPSSRNLAAALKQIQVLAEAHQSKKQPNEESKETSEKESKVESKGESRFLQPNSPSSKNLEAALRQLQVLAEAHQAKKQLNEESKEASKKESTVESKEKHRNESKDEYKEKYRKEYKDESREKHRQEYKHESREKYRKEYSNSRRDR